MDSLKEERNMVSEDWKTFQSAQQQLIEDLNRQRDEILEERLEQLGLEMYLKEEKGRRFKRFMREIEGDKETIYFNDGSVNGLRIVTFVNSLKRIYSKDKRCSTITIAHY